MNTVNNKGFGNFDMEMLGISEEVIKEVDASEAEVVSRVLMSRIKDIIVVIRPDGITFNTTCIRSMIDVVHIQMFLDREKHLLYVAPTEEYDRDSYRWCNVTGGKRISRKITGREFGDRMYKLMHWSKAYSYRVTGYPSRQIGTEDEYLLVFSLDEYDQTLLTEKGMAAAGVEDKDLGEDAKQIHMEMAEVAAQKERAREEAKISGKRKRVRNKKSYFGAVQDGAFGIQKKDHVNRINMKPLEQLEIISPLTESKDSEEPDPGMESDYPIRDEN